MIELGAPHIQHIAAPIFFAGLYDVKPAWKFGLQDSWFTPVPIWDANPRDLARIRIATCPWFGCKTYTSIFSINYDGSIGEPIVGWPGSNLDYIGDVWWDDRPWCWMVTSFLDGTAGSNQTYTSPLAWNNANNTIEPLGAGGSGGRARVTSSTNGAATGGGAGAYQKHTNFSFAVPGTTTATYQIGAGGTGGTSPTSGSAGAAGNAGGDSWFDGATYGASTVGAKGGGAGQFTTGTSVPVSGASGGSAASGRGNSTAYNGGGSGNCTAVLSGTGGGGAAGPNGAGGSSANAGAAAGSDGGQGDNGSGGLGGTLGNPSGVNGDPGTEWDASHGSGGGGGAALATVSTGSSGTGGLYGAGSGGAYLWDPSGSSTITNTAGAKGLIVLNYVPSYSGVPNRLLRATYLRR